MTILIVLKMSEEPQNNTNNNIPKKRYKKKKKDFLSNAKKYGKKGQLGRGTKIPDELYQYFVGILDAMKQGIESEEDKGELFNKYILIQLVTLSLNFYLINSTRGSIISVKVCGIYC